MFLVGKEDRASMAEALKLIEHFNPEWWNNIVMADKAMLKSVWDYTQKLHNIKDMNACRHSCNNCYSLIGHGCT